MKLLCRFAPSALRARILGRFAPSKFKKKSVSHSTQNGLKHIEMQKKIFYPFDSLHALRVAQRATKPNLTYPCGRFAPSGFALHVRILSRFAPLGFAYFLGCFATSGVALATYPMTLPGSQGVSMPSFITIGSKLLALEGYKHT